MDSWVPGQLLLWLLKILLEVLHMGVTAQAIRAGKAYVELGITGMQNAQRQLKSFGDSLKNLGTKVASIGAIALAPLGAAASSFADVGSGLLGMSQRTGVSVEALSQLSLAASLTGTNLETLEHDMRHMSKTIIEATQGSEEAHRAFAILGLNFQDLKTMSPEQQLQKIGEALSKVENPTQKAASAMAIFGRSGSDLIGLLANMEKFRDVAKSWGLTVSTESAQAAKDFQNSLTLLWAVAKQGIFIIGSALAPEVKELAFAFSGAVRGINLWISANRPMVVQLAQVAIGVIAAGAALIGLGTAISTLRFAVSPGLQAFMLIKTVAMTSFSLLSSIVLAVLSPLGLVTAALVALGGYFLYTSGIGGKALKWLSDTFGQLWDTVSVTWKGIVSALQSGDIGLAVEVAGAGMRVAWENALNKMKGPWLDFKFFVLNVWAEMVNDLAKYMVKQEPVILGILNKIFSGFEMAWNKLTKPGAEADALNESLKAQGDALDDQLKGNKDKLLNELDRQNNADQLKREKQKAMQKADTTDLDEAQKKLDEALAKVEAAKKESKLKLPPGMGEMPNFGEAMPAMKNKLVAGTFNPFAIGGLGPSNRIQEEINKNGKEANNKLEEIIKQLKDAGWKFS
jgi:hypothetical protein